MPEYLSPGVFIEEIDVGVRPIEGVSTSTAGMVGVTRRGPVNVPMLVTSFPEFQRVFGGYLDHAVYGHHAHLPHAVEGFFQNGGKRLWVTRVVADQVGNLATTAAVTLADQGERTGFDDTVLAFGARPGDDLILAEETAGLAAGQQVRIGDGTSAEYAELDAAPADLDSRVTGVEAPVHHDHAAGAVVTVVPLADQAADTLDQDAAAGGLVIHLDTAIAALVAGEAVRIGGAVEELAVVAEIEDGTRLTLTSPLTAGHLAGDAVSRVTEGAAGAGAALTNPARGGDGFLVLDGAPPAAGTVVRIGADGNDPRREYHTLTDLEALRLTAPAAYAHPVGEPVTEVAFAVVGGPGSVDTNPAEGLEAGAQTVVLDDVGPLAADHFLRFGNDGEVGTEIIQVAEVDTPSNTVTLRQPLLNPHTSAAPVRRMTHTPSNTSHLLAALATGGEIVLLADDGTDFVAGDLVQIGALDSGRVEFLELAASNLRLLDLSEALDASHGAGSPLGRRDALLEIHALDPGDWGDELRVTAQADTTQLSTQVTAGNHTTLPVTLASATGVEEGTILELGAAGSGNLAKVSSVDGATVELTTEGPGFAVAPGDAVRTRDFRLDVAWIYRGRTLVSETHRHLSLDRRHSRWIEGVLGDVDGPLRPSDRRPEGRSDLVRVRDLATEQQALDRIRVGPDLLLDPGPGGTTRPAGRFLDGGSNPPAGIVDATFEGADGTEPEDRTGIFALRNERMSIVAVPGVTSETVQGALIRHCERERFRFAVLDSLPGADPSRGASLGEVVDQRNLHDTRYAALYYPWCLRPEPEPANPAQRRDVAIPPSGHVVGIYARTDVERGVHKAPANAVIRGIVGLQRKVLEAEQDLLNPSPVNVDVLRDFRERGRGLRVWGGRVITSDTDWKYVNVRRLFLFLEESLEIGTQWVVFEPNGRPLWSRVRQTITAFLTRVWRDGALQGATPEEAFFVRVDESTMTQDDIDNGRLIIQVGVAPVKPAEFVIIRIFQSTVEAREEQ